MVRDRQRGQVGGYSLRIGKGETDQGLTAWTFFFDMFSGIVMEVRIKNRFSPWFNRDLAELLHLKNGIWRKAWHKHTQADWVSFR